MNETEEKFKAIIHLLNEKEAIEYFSLQFSGLMISLEKDEVVMGDEAKENLNNFKNKMIEKYG